jgi:hypothetical protein
MKRIPASFQIGSLTFKVTRVSAEEMEKRAGIPAYGLFLPDSQEILVHTAGKDCSAALASQAFYHELGHAILWVMSHKDQKNEKVVDHLGHILKQFADTAR